MRHLAFVLALLLTACLDVPDHGPGTVGSAADMTTPPGDYVGYRVVMPCVNPYPTVGVIGTGSVVITNVTEISAAGQELHTHLVDLASIWGWGGYSLGCEAGVGTPIDLSDWRDVDTVIARTGAWLVEHDYALQINIAVGGPPVPHAN
jgi:hypothetical protein